MSAPSSTMLDEMKSWVRFSPADEERLRALAPLAEPHLHELADVFYARILEHPGASRVIRDEAQLQRLKRTLTQWGRELMSGPWDDAYVQRRERIGRVHVEVGLPPRYMFMAMHVWREGLCHVAHRHFPPDLAHDICESLGRVTDMDLAIMTSTYVERREAVQLATLEEILISHLPVTVLLIDHAGVVTAATRGDIRLFGHVPAVGRPWAEALPATLVEAGRLTESLERALHTGREIALPRVDVTLEGASRAFRFSLVPLDHPHARALVHIEELTEAIDTEARLRRSEALAQLGTMSAAVAHELRNPLAGISGAVQVITRSMPTEDSRKVILEKVEQQVQRLNILATELLDFGRPTQARTVLLHLAELAKTSVDLVSRQFPTVRGQMEGDGVALADPNLTQQVLLNLFLNGCHAALAGARVAAGEVAQVRLQVWDGGFRVSDNGDGFPPDKREHAFQPFYTTKSRGTGLGLANCKKMLQAMGGTIEIVDGAPGALPGAAFEVTLPQPER